MLFPLSVIASSGVLEFHEGGLIRRGTFGCYVVLILQYWQKYLSYFQKEKSYKDKSLHAGPFLLLLLFSLSGLSCKGEKHKK